MKKQAFVTGVLNYKDGKERKIKLIDGEGMTLVTMKEDGSAEYTGVGKINEVLSLSAMLEMCKERSNHTKDEYEYIQLINAVEDVLLGGLRWIEEIPGSVEGSVPFEDAADSNNPLD